ncbi:MAG: hypothetical protein KY467_01110 [Gemmatimonadetes bacterium]|nr:hypothetical protein [Gemmatimonadota bacterium]
MILDAAILARLHPDTIVQVGIPAGALVQALAGTPQGQATITTRVAARTFGWAHTDWARWAREYEHDPRFPGVDPPVRDGKVWRLPREWCEAVHDELRKRSSAPPKATVPANETRLSDRRGNHGPRSKRHPEKQQAATAPRRLQALP